MIAKKALNVLKNEIDFFLLYIYTRVGFHWSYDKRLEIHDSRFLRKCPTLCKVSELFGGGGVLFCINIGDLSEVFCIDVCVR